MEDSTEKNKNNIQSNFPGLAFQGEALEPAAQKQTSIEKPKRKLPLGKILVTGIIILITLFAFGLIAYLMIGNQTKQSVITTYEECVAAGYPIMESYPEQCTVPGTASFTRELTTDEIEKLNPGVYEGDEFSFEYPTETFALAHLVCKNNSSPGPQLVEKSSNNRYSNVGCVHGIKFDIRKVEKVNEMLDDPDCYSMKKEEIKIDNHPATSYTTEFIGGNVDKCTEGPMGKYSLKERYIYVENYSQLYLIWWPIDQIIDQIEYNQILYTFKFTDSEFFSDNSNEIKPNINPYIDSEYGFSINFPSDWYFIEDSSSVFISNQNVNDFLEMTNNGISVEILTVEKYDFYMNLFSSNVEDTLKKQKALATVLANNIKINDYKAIKYSLEPPQAWEGENFYSYHIAIEKDKNIIDIGFATFRQQEGQKNLKLYDEILSTLKFNE